MRDGISIVPGRSVRSTYCKPIKQNVSSTMRTASVEPLMDGVPLHDTLLCISRAQCRHLQGMFTVAAMSTLNCKVQVWICQQCKQATKRMAC